VTAIGNLVGESVRLSVQASMTTFPGLGTLEWQAALQLRSNQQDLPFDGQNAVNYSVTMKVLNDRQHFELGWMPVCKSHV
jgi:hypothetical protein